MELSTPRLQLRELRASDGPAVLAYTSDPEATRYVTFEASTLDDVNRFVTAMVAAAAETPRTTHALAVVVRDTGAVIGTAKLEVTSRDHDRGEIGYALARTSWGNGYATEAARALLRFGFTQLALHKITALCDPRHEASRRVLAKAGMTVEGRLRHHVRVRGEWCDRLTHAAFAASWDRD